ncbi:MAG: hypothetical protein V3S41_01420 [Spirochaetia bacterium]
MSAKPDPVVHAYVRAHATLRLVAELPPDLIREAYSKRATIQLLTPGGPSCSIRVNNGAVSFSATRRFFPTVSLWFPRPVQMATLLSGGKAPVVPIPSSLRFLGGVSAFRALTGAVKAAFQDPAHRVRLLLMGTLFALEEVASHDAYVAARVARIPAGTIGVSVENEPEIQGWFRKEPEGISSGAGASDTEPNAELVFVDRETADALLTGKLSAALAVAERRVRLYGRLPMIQNLFPILDRVATYMGGQS